MQDRLKFRIAVFERYNTDEWEFSKFIENTDKFGVSTNGNVIQENVQGYIIHLTREKTPKNVYRTMEVMKCTGLKDKNGKNIYEGDIVIHYHEKKDLVPVTDKKPFEAPYGIDEESGLPLAYRTKKIIRYKGIVSIEPLNGVHINLRNRCHWWSGIKDNVLPKIEVIGNIYENEDLLK